MPKPATSEDLAKIAAAFRRMLDVREEIVRLADDFHKHIDLSTLADPDMMPRILEFMDLGKTYQEQETRLAPILRNLSADIRGETLQ